MNQTVLIIGTSDCAVQTAGMLSQSGFKAVLVCEGTDYNHRTEEWDIDSPTKSISFLNNTCIEACRGAIGNFEVDLISKTERFTLKTGMIIIAEETVRHASYGSFGFKPSSKILTLSKMQNELDRSTPSSLRRFDQKHMVFLFGLSGESHPSIMAEVMDLAAKLHRDYGAQCYVISGNLKVAGPNLEAQYHQTQAKGIVFFKPKLPLPALTTSNNGVPEISFFDSTIHEFIQLTPDFLVADERICPAPNLARLASIFSLETDSLGYIQSDNVHRLPVYTNRKGILAGGPARGCFAPWDSGTEAENLHLAVLSAQIAKSIFPTNPPKINSDRCIHCLTCFRICPHAAILFEKRHLTIGDGCEECGICMSVCPRQAIAAEKETEYASIHLPQKSDDISQRKTFIPELAVFGCDRSAKSLIQMMDRYKIHLSARLSWTKLTCAGAVSETEILSAFNKGTDGVFVLTCHPGNCHSGTGNEIARQKITLLNQHLTDIGLDIHRLKIASLAPNMGAEFIQQVSAFTERLHILGPV